MIDDGRFDPPYILLDFDSGTKIIIKQNDEQILLEEYIKREVRKALGEVTDA